MKLAVISDTHGLLRPEVKARIKECGAVIHGGDIGSRTILDQLEEMMPVYAVCGNNDGSWAHGLPLFLELEFSGLRFFVVHDRAEIPRDLSGIDVVIFGHSHRYFQEEKDGVLLLNPGSCGKRRFNLPLDMAVMTVESGRYEVERIPLENRCLYP